MSKTAKRLSRILIALTQGMTSLASRPKTAIALGIFGLSLTWLILTASLPYVFAKHDPDIALLLNPKNPIALLEKAKRLRKKLQDLIDSETSDGSELGTDKAERTKLIARFAAPKLSALPTASKEKLIEDIKFLAIEIIKNDPLNATAFRLLGEVTKDPDQVLTFMQAAADRSRRETVALFWLLNHAYYKKDWKGVLHHADILLRTRTKLKKYIVGYLGQVISDPDGRKLLVDMLAKQPEWRSVLFRLIPSNVSDSNVPLQLMIELRDTQAPITNKELEPYLSFLLKKNRIDLAYNAWIQLQPEEKLSSIALLQNPGFDVELTGLPFDWKVSRGRNATIDFVKLEPLTDDRAIYIKFGTGRVKLPKIHQVVALTPGSYRISGKHKGKIISKRGLRWQLKCYAGKRNVLGQTKMLLGETADWQQFEFEVRVPNEPGCNGQILYLIHDARSASEQIISGEVWYNDITLLQINY